MMHANLTQTILKPLPNKAPFRNENDDRLKWLEAFLKWLKSWKDSIDNENEFFTNETYEAIVLTTNSTIAKIRYMLRELKLEFVLTRKFNSDNVERKFSALRQANGGNYNMNAKAAIYGVEKLLRTGISYTALACNVPLQREKQQRRKKEIKMPNRAPTYQTHPKQRASEMLKLFKKEDFQSLEDLKKGARLVIINLLLKLFQVFMIYVIDFSSKCEEKPVVALTGGYLLRTLEEREICVECCEALTLVDIHDPAGKRTNSLISSLSMSHTLSKILVKYKQIVF